MSRIHLALILLCPSLLAQTASAQATFNVDPTAGNNTLNAVFDADIGERIVAMSAAVGCSATYDEKAGTVSGACQVPLMSVTVDNEPTKAAHFHQWATQKKSLPKDCVFSVTFKDVKVGTLQPQTPVKFTTQGPFTVCGRTRADKGLETISGTALMFATPAGEPRKVRIRANVAGFSRASYQIGPQFTDGWAARVQSLASVVADVGAIELSLFFKEPAKPAAPATK
jgi:hypothetical protein